MEARLIPSWRRTVGHSQVSLTLNTYSHVLPALQEDAAAKMNAALGGA